MGGGMSFENTTGADVLVTLSQVGPLHWKKVPAGQTLKIDCGQVYFTVQVELWTGRVPGGWDVAKPFVIGLAGGVLAVAGIGIVVSAVAIGAAAATGAGTAVALAEGGSVGALSAAGISAAATGAAGTSAAAAFWSGLAAAGGVAIATSAAEASAEHKNSKERKVTQDRDRWISEGCSRDTSEWLAKERVIAARWFNCKNIQAVGQTVQITSENTTDHKGNVLLSFKMSLKL
eukprot:m.20579 g.20579  ORF g.20579 m.20579 type:complete len:232 (+) comp28032_c0_seq1:1850-2545(+)